MKARRFLVTVLLLAITAGLVSCGSLGNRADTTVQLVKVTRGNLTTTVNGSGHLEAVKNRTLAFGTSGQIQTILVKEGQQVEKGDQLATLTANALELGVAQAEFAYNQAQLGITQANIAVQSAELSVKQAEEQQKWVPSDINKDQTALARAQVETAKQSLNVAENSLQLAEKSLEESRRQLDESILKAPFDGIIAKVYVKEGDVVTPAVPAAVIIDPSEMQFGIQIDEIDVVNVIPGMKVKIELDAMPELVLEGSVDFISDLPATQTGVVVYDTRITFNVPENQDLKVGMSASADIITAVRENVLLAPDRAISKNDNGENVVTVRIDDKDQVKVVVIGLSDGIQTEIVSGLQEGENVVVERSSQSMGGFF